MTIKPRVNETPKYALVLMVSQPRYLDRVKRERRRGKDARTV